MYLTGIASKSFCIVKLWSSIYHKLGQLCQHWHSFKCMGHFNFHHTLNSSSCMHACSCMGHHIPWVQHNLYCKYKVYPVVFLDNILSYGAQLWLGTVNWGMHACAHACICGYSFKEMLGYPWRRVWIKGVMEVEMAHAFKRMPMLTQLAQFMVYTWSQLHYAKWFWCYTSQIHLRIMFHVYLALASFPGHTSLPKEYSFDGLATLVTKAVARIVYLWLDIALLCVYVTQNCVICTL